MSHYKPRTALYHQYHNVRMQLKCAPLTVTQVCPCSYLFFSNLINTLYSYQHPPSQFFLLFLASLAQLLSVLTGLCNGIILSRRCCSASSNLSQEMWSEQSVSFDDGKAGVVGSDEDGNIEEGEIDCFDGKPRKVGEPTHNRYRMFPDSTPSTNPVYHGGGMYGGSYSTEQQTKYTSHAKYNLPPRMQRLLQASAAASRSQMLASKIQPQSTIARTPPSTSAWTPSPWQSYDWRTRLRDIFQKSSQLLLDSHCHIDFLYDRTGFKGTFKKYMHENEDTFPENFAGCVTVFCHPHTFSTDGEFWSFDSMLMYPCE